ncbi:MAG: hypothetical protein EAZ99_04850 [Alphaproteobacteria bacterium]|nr:MAG: hypothetical protein EAZ99_04850 [Alphaproteobacteria bacterium]
MALSIAIAGVHEQGLYIADTLTAAGHRCTLVTIDRALAEKNRASGWIDYRTQAEKRGLPLHHTTTYALKSPDDHAWFAAQGFDAMVFGGWQRLVPGEVLSTLRFGCIGQHGSAEFLPRGRGRSPLNWSVIEGRQRLVWHLFQVTPGIDDGPILDWMDVDILPWDDCETLYLKIGIVVKQMLVRTLAALEAGTLTPQPQIGPATHYGKRTPEDGRIDWSWPLLRIHNLIRAVTKPYPGAFADGPDGRVVLWRAQPFDTRLAYPHALPGMVVEVFEDGRHLVNTVDGLLLVTEWEGTPPPLRACYQ